MKKFSEIELWKDVSPEEWKNWKWQLSHCINTLEELEKTITISERWHVVYLVPAIIGFVMSLFALLFARETNAFD